MNSIAVASLPGHPSESRLKPGQFYGQTVNLRRVSGLQLSEVNYYGRQSLPRHSHQLAFFCLLLKGTYVEHYYLRSNSYSPYTVVFHPPDETHASEMSDSGAFVFNIEVEAELLDRLLECSRMPQPFADLRGGDLVWLATRLYQEYQQPGNCSALTIEGLVLEMLATAGRHQPLKETRPPAWLKQVVDLLHNEYMESFSLSQIAELMGVTPLHLSRVFRRFHRQTIGEYVKRLRIQVACQKLTDPAASLSDVANSTGFADQSHFTRTFKQVTGLTPGEFRLKGLTNNSVAAGFEMV
jgi:AraC family transcriptional regulator